MSVYVSPLCLSVCACVSLYVSGKDWERADLLAVLFVVLSLSQMSPGPHQN